MSGHKKNKVKVAAKSGQKKKQSSDTINLYVCKNMGNAQNKLYTNKKCASWKVQLSDFLKKVSYKKIKSNVQQILQPFTRACH
jgi:anaerobic ribonucleoside-triphosphate reductase